MIIFNYNRSFVTGNAFMVTVNLKNCKLSNYKSNSKYCFRMVLMDSINRIIYNIEFSV